MTTDPAVPDRRPGARAGRVVALAAVSSALALVLSACSPVVSPQPTTTSPTPSGVPATAATTSQPETEPPDPTADIALDCGQVVAPTEPRLSPNEGLAVYSTSDGLSTYDIASNENALIDPSTSPAGLRPRFRTPGLVSFVQRREQPDDGHTFGQDSLVERDLGGDGTTEILRLPDSLLAYDWNDEGTVLAYLLRTQTPTLVGPHLLCSFDSRTGRTALFRQIENPFGTGVGQHAETAVSWAPGGGSVLVTDTAAVPSLFVVTADGHDVVAPQTGTFGRWLSDTEILMQQDPQDAAAPWPWLVLSSTTGATQPADLPNAAFRPAVSPSGGLIAFDDGDPTKPAVYVFDIEARTAKRLEEGFVAAVWIGPDVVAATAVTACAGEFCDIPWVPIEKTVAIDVNTGSIRALALPTTLNEVTRYGAIDVLLP